MFREAWGLNTIEIGFKILDYFYDMEHNGEKLFKVLIGNTPPSNKAALAYIKKLGFDVIGEIPYVGKISYQEASAYVQKRRRQPGNSSDQNAV